MTKIFATVMFAAAFVGIGCGSDGPSCKAACDNIEACRASGYADTDLQNDPVYASTEACVTWCEESVDMYGEDAKAAVACAESTSDCVVLDDRCDVY